jgi:WD40 repeat protein
MGSGSLGHAFISYVREDSARVDELQRVLEANGIAVWRDLVRLLPGDDWEAGVRRAITDDALVFIACFSRASESGRKTYMNAELALAVEELRLRRPDVPWLIPVRFDDVQPPNLNLGAGRTLRSLQWADLSGTDRDDQAGRLVRSVRRLLEPPVPDTSADHGAARVSAEWALRGKATADREYRLLGHSRGVISRDEFELALDRYSLGNSVELPQVAVSWLPPGERHGRYVAIAVHDRAPGTPRDPSGRPVTSVRYFCLPRTAVAVDDFSYEALYQAVAGIELPAGEGAPLTIALPGRRRPLSVDQPSGDQELVRRAAEYLAAGDPVRVTGADEVSLAGRLRFIDAVMSVLPAGARTQVAASTAVGTARRHSFRLCFGPELSPARPPEGGDRVLRWGAVGQPRISPPPRLAVVAPGALVSPPPTADPDGAADRANVVVDTQRGTGPCVFSPDGALLAFGSGYHVKIADPAAGQVLRVLHGHQDEVTAVACSADGTRVAAGARDGAVHVWDTERGTLLATLTAYRRPGDGLSLAHAGPVTAVAFSADGTLATGSADGTASFWDSTWGAPRELGRTAGAVRAIAFTADGTRLAVASGPANIGYPSQTDGGVTIRDVRGGDAVVRLDLGNGEAGKLAFSPRGDVVAVALGSTEVRVCDARTGAARGSLPGPGGPVLAVTFLLDGVRLAAAASPGHGEVAVRTWDTLTRREVGRAAYRHDRDDVRGTAFSPDASLLAVAYERGMQIRDVTAEARLTTVSAPAPTAVPLLARDGTRIATASADGAARIWDVPTVAPVAAIRASTRRTASRLLALAPDGSLAAIQSAGGVVDIVDHAGRLRGTVTSRGGQLRWFEFLGDGALAAGNSLRDDRVLVWDTASGVRRGALTRRGVRLVSRAFSADGALAALSSASGRAWIADVATGSRLAVLLKNPGDVAAPEFRHEFNREFTLTAAAFSPDRELVAGASENSLTRHGVRDAFVRLWPLSGIRGARGLRLPQRPPLLPVRVTLHGPVGRVTDLAFSPDSCWLAAAAEDRTVHCWAVAGEGHWQVSCDTPVDAVAFSADGTVLITVTREGIIRYLDAATAKPVAERVPLADGGLATLLPDGSCRIDGDPGNNLWWTTGRHRLPPGRTGLNDPGIGLLAADAAIFPGTPGQAADPPSGCDRGK